MRINEIKTILQNSGLWAKKSLGQHFLIDENILPKIISAAGIKNNDTIVEIGPGLGVLTSQLLQEKAMVIAIEKDKKMAEILASKMSNFQNLNIICDDILKLDLSSLGRSIAAGSGHAAGGWGPVWNARPTRPEASGPRLPKRPIGRGTTLAPLDISSQDMPCFAYKVISNLPYNIANRVIRKFLEAENTPPHQGFWCGGKPKLMVLMVQKEVAEKICALDGKESILSNSVKFYGKPEIIAIVPKTAFWPIPKVDSAILRISQIANRLSPEETEKFFHLVKIGFSSPRKKLYNNLAAGLKIPSNKARELFKKARPELVEGRAEELKVEDWVRLVKVFAAAVVF